MFDLKDTAVFMYKAAIRAVYVNIFYLGRKSNENCKLNFVQDFVYKCNASPCHTLSVF